jgi:DNA repair exonuclease SbcCD nuclease subunit
LVDAGIKVIILIGNHDVCRRHHALSPINSFKFDNISIIEEPTLMEFGDKIFMLFPYSLEVERGHIEIKEQFCSFVEECNKKIKDSPDMQSKDILFFGHFGVKGAVLQQYAAASDEMDVENKITTPKKSRFNIDAKDISFGDLESINAKYIFLGDYHQHQVLAIKKGIAMYAGSLERTNMSELDQKKGYIVYDDRFEDIAPMGKTKFIEYPKCRPMVELKGNTQDILKSIEDLPSKTFLEAIVKISFVGSNQDLLEFSLNLETIRKNIKKKINPIHMYHQQKVIEEAEEEQAGLLEQEIMEKGGHINEDLVTKVVEEMIKEQESNKEEQQILVDMAKDIYKETMENK